MCTSLFEWGLDFLSAGVVDMDIVTDLTQLYFYYRYSENIFNYPYEGNFEISTGYFWASLGVLLINPIWIYFYCDVKLLEIWHSPNRRALFKILCGIMSVVFIPLEAISFYLGIALLPMIVLFGKCFCFSNELTD